MTTKTALMTKRIGTKLPQMDARNLDGNVFSVMGRVAKTLQRAGRHEDAKALMTEVQTKAKSYDEALALFMTKVEFVWGTPTSPRRPTGQNVMPAGKYVVADPCYVLDRAVYDALGEATEWKWDGDKPFTFGDGTKRIWILPTKHGDGSYSGTDGEQYTVDSGTIAIIEMAPEYFLEGWERSVGYIADVQDGFLCATDEDGVLTFGDVVTIQTDDPKCEYCGSHFCEGECEDEEESENDDDDDY